MGNIGSTNKISAQDRAVLDLKIQRDKLHQYQKRITTLTAHETTLARDCLARGDRSHALLALRRKKYQQSLLGRTDAQLAQLEALVGEVEFAAVQRDVLIGLRQGTEVLKAIQGEMGGVEGVERLVEETAEARAYQAEISRTLSAHMTNQDEDEVEDELEAMERDQLKHAEPAAAAPIPSLPSAPDSAPISSPEQASEETSAKAAAEAKRAHRRLRARERAAEARGEVPQPVAA